MKSNTPSPLSLIIWLAACGCPPVLRGQSPVASFSAAYVTTSGSVSNYTALPASTGTFSGCSATTYTYTFGNGSSNQYKLNSFNANGSTYFVSPGASPVVKLRRVDNANATGSRSILYMESTASTATACPSPATLNFKPPYLDVMENILDAGMLNQGIDNLFTNASNGDGNNNNVERVDVLFPTSLNTASPGQAGFAIFDRGSNFQHDPCRIVAITGLDASGNPASFGAVKICAGGNGTNNNGDWGHPSTAAGNKQFATYVMRKDAAETRLRVSSNVNQEIGGVFYTFADLGISSGQPLFGYALLGPDGAANPSSAQLLNINNSAVYPTQTTEAAGGGLDLVAVNTVFATGSYIVLPLTIAAFTGAIRNGQPSLQWELKNVEGNEEVLLERSGDGVVFSTIYTKWPDERIAASSEEYSDGNAPLAPSIYYRLKIVSVSGQISYSQIISLPGEQDGAGWRIYPTVISPDQSLKLEGLPDGPYSISFYDLQGRRKTVNIRSLNKEALVRQPSGALPPRLYWLKVDGIPGIRAFMAIP